ncbi:hypothetical protein Hbl1158_10135 [Halobaculum sp. CBA1158]|uniref:hypothetical protein n=1 Tax=Halobaculum sp. CBA1158 TaxID=2904243 RepID=UPI001F48BF80|nr:hypothetical protein [Halobaculum sp. CBA1158]UIO98892.1 hypothetical protein Hbl1158_10135 [Halobaculum sp. CBA1158]
MILVNDSDLERAAAGEVDLELITLEYVGDRSSIATGALVSQGYWPSTAPLNGGTTYVAFVRDEGLGYLEAREDVEVSYAPEDIAEALLAQNYLPSNVFGDALNTEVRDRLERALDFEWQGRSEEANRKELRAVAGVDDDEADAEDDGPDRVDELVDEYSRGELKDAAEALRESTDEISLQSKKREFAAWLAEQPPDNVADELEG